MARSSLGSDCAGSEVETHLVIQKNRTSVMIVMTLLFASISDTFWSLRWVLVSDNG